MGRTKSFDINQTLARCARVFIAHGYEGTSIDQLVAGTGLLRGSLYGAFGSKRGVFIETLTYTLAGSESSTEKLDLCIVALQELAANDPEVRNIVKAFFQRTKNNSWPQLLGGRLLDKSKVTEGE